MSLVDSWIIDLTSDSMLALFWTNLSLIALRTDFDMVSVRISNGVDGVDGPAPAILSVSKAFGTSFQ